MPGIFRKLLVGRKYQYASLGFEFGDADIGDLQDGGPEIFELVQQLPGFLAGGVAMGYEVTILVLVPGLFFANGPISGKQRTNTQHHRQRQSDRCSRLTRRQGGSLRFQDFQAWRRASHIAEHR